MSIVWVVPMLAPSYGESPPAGEPDLIRQPGVASPPPPASARLRRQAVAPSGRTPERGSRVVSLVTAYGAVLHQVNAAKAVCRACAVRAACLPVGLQTSQDGIWGEQPRRAACPTPQERPARHGAGRDSKPAQAAGGLNRGPAQGGGHPGGAPLRSR